MDYRALQHKLFAMDPVDPAKELAMLRATAQTPTPLEETNYITESVQVTKGSLPIDIESISDFARLAGVRLDEKQLTGRAGQAKGSDPAPKAEYRRDKDKHPLKNKLVGEAGAMSAFKSGFDTYNTIGTGNRDLPRNSQSSLTPSSGENPAPVKAADVAQLARLLQIKDPQRFSAAVVSASQGNVISRQDSQLLGEAFQNLLLLQDTKKREVFKAIVELTPRQASQPAVKNKITAQPKTPTTTVTSSIEYKNSKTTIKEHLYRLLEEKKLK